MLCVVVCWLRFVGCCLQGLLFVCCEVAVSCVLAAVLFVVY